MAAAYLYWSDPTAASLAAGSLAALGGMLLRGWAAGHLAKNEALATSGPFAYTRNPLYVGTLVVAAGFAVAGRSGWLAALFAAYFALVYGAAIGEEESRLRELFPAYDEYARRVPRLWPRLTSGDGGGRFRWSLYRRNREYEAALGYVAGVAVLAGKLM